MGRSCCCLGGFRLDVLGGGGGELEFLIRRSLKDSADSKELGFGVPYFNTFLETCYLKGTNYEIKVCTFFPWLLQSPEKDLWGLIRDYRV